MLKVGITGSIGSGKTTVCKIFERLGIPIYYADDRAKALVKENEKLIKSIKALLGENAYTPEGEYNRAYVAGIVFSNTEKLKALNGIIHPAVGKDVKDWQAAQTNVPYTLKEAALLFEAGSYKRLDKIICVVAPEDLRIERVMKRDGVEEVAVRARMDKQWPQIEKMRRSDFLIYNDGSESLIQQVFRVHRYLCEGDY